MSAYPIHQTSYRIGYTMITEIKMSDGSTQKTFKSIPKTDEDYDREQGHWLRAEMRKECNDEDRKSGVYTNDDYQSDLQLQKMGIAQ